MNESYLTIMDCVEAELVEKHSRFLGHMCHVTSKEQSETFINKIKSEYKDASHNVPVYLIYETGVVHFSDDGEPQGTAGKPIIEVLKREQIFDVCVVITRYFGGVLLGTGGLIRAYSNICKLLIQNAVLANCKMCYSLTICVDYSDLAKAEHIINEFNIRVVNKSFSDKVRIDLSVEDYHLKKLSDALIDATSAKVSIKNNGKSRERIPI